MTVGGQQLDITLLLFRFSCPLESCECRLSDKERQEKEKSTLNFKSCPYRRSIRFQDSLLFFQASLSSMIDDLHIASKREGLPLEAAFPTSKHFCDSWNFTNEQFEKFVSVKCPMPYEYCTDYESLVNTTTPPPPSAFKSTLRGIEEISPAEHNTFVSMWTTLGCSNLLDLMHLYAIGDVTMYSDAVGFLFEKLFNLTNLWPSHFLTLASLAVASLLYNGRSPSNRRNRLTFPFLDEKTYNLISNNCLLGGYAVNSSQFCHFNFGYDVIEEQKGNSRYEELEPNMTAALFLDYNCLYPSVLEGTFRPYPNLV